MKWLRGGLVILLAAEAALLGTSLGRRLARPAPPRPQLARLVDSWTARSFEERLQPQAGQDRPEAWLELGQACAVYGFFPEADLCLGRAAELDPDSFDNWFWWGLVLNRLGRTTESTERLTRAIELNLPAIDECRYIIARNQLREDRPAEAEVTLRQLGLEHLPGRYLLAYLLAHTERASEAMPILDRLIAEQPDIHRLYQLRARAAERLGRTAAARADRERAERAPRTIDTDLVADRLGGQSHRFGLDRRIAAKSALAKRGDLDAASRGLRDILDVTYRPRVAELLARIHMVRRQPGDAARVLEELISRNGESPEILTELAAAYGVSGKPAESVRCLQRALHYRIDSEVCYRLALHLQELGNASDTVGLRALADHAEGLAAFRTNRLADAVTLLRKASKVDHREQAESWFHLGESLRHLGRADDARDAYRRCLELKPHHGLAADVLERLGQGS